MKRVLKYINAMPFPFTMKHYQVFGDTTSRMKEGQLMSPESWDALREEHPFFSIPKNRDEWVAVSELAVKKDGQDYELIERAREVASLLVEKEVDKLFSIGVGGAALEYHLKKRLPQLHLTCSDYSQVTVDTLQKVFYESDAIIRFDMLKDNWHEIREKYIGDRGACLIYRIDASLSDQEWKYVFHNAADAGINKILIIPTGMLTWLSVYNRKSREVRWFFKKTPIIFSGFVRTKKRFQQFWAPWYTEESVTCGGLKSFFLARKK